MMKRFIKKPIVIISFLFFALLVSALQFTPPEIIYKIFIQPAVASNITNLSGSTGYVGKEDIRWGTGQDTDTYTVPTYSGGTITLTKLPSLFANAASIIKGKWHVAAMAGDHGNAALTGSLAWVINTLGADPATIELPGNQTYSLTTNLAIPETIVLNFQRGAILGGTGNISGNGLKHIQAGAWQIFSTSGTVTFGTDGPKEVLVEWWGIDGTADDVEIGKAVAAAAAVKTPVLLVSSSYTVSGSISMPDNATIYSKGKRSTITVSNNTNSNLFSIMGDNVTIKNIITDGNKANQSAGSFIRDGNPGTGIDNLHVENCEASNFKEYGVMIEETCANHRYINNKINSCDKTGIIINPGVADTTDNIRFEGNHVIGSGVNGIQVYHATLVNNSNIFIINNYVINTTAVPIEIQRAKWGIVSGNIVRGSGSNGISTGSCSYQTITGNIIEDQTNYGIELSGGGSNITIQGNSIKNVGVGIIATAYGLTNLIVDGNTIDTTTAGANHHGIRLQDVDHLVVSDNEVIDAYDRGIDIYGSVPHGRHDAVVSGNLIVFSSSRPTAEPPTGIHFMNFDRAQVANNTIRIDIASGWSGGTWTGVIDVVTGCKHISITSNQILGTVADVDLMGIWFSAYCDNVFIDGNIFQNIKNTAIHTSQNDTPFLAVGENNRFVHCGTDTALDSMHKYYLRAWAPLGGALWYRGDPVWNTGAAASASPGWVCTDRIETEIKVAASATDVNIDVDDTTGMAVSDKIIIELDNGTWHRSTISAVVDADTVTIGDAMPSAAAVNNDVITNEWKTMANLGA